MQESKNLKVNAIEQEKTWGRKLEPLHWVVTLSIMEISHPHSLFFLDLEGENENYTRILKRA